MAATSIIIWLMRSFGDAREDGDSKLTIKKTRKGYSITYTDRKLSINDAMQFDDYETFVEYMDLFTSNLLADRDRTEPFLTMQYTIPTFPSTVIKCSDLVNNETYNLMMRSIEFYMRYTVFN